MSFNVSFFARDAQSARNKLAAAYAPAAVKALVELAIAGMPAQGHAGASQAPASDGARAAGNAASPKLPRLCGILVETHGHIDDGGGVSSIGAFRVEPCYD